MPVMVTVSVWRVRLAITRSPDQIPGELLGNFLVTQIYLLSRAVAEMLSTLLCDFLLSDSGLVGLHVALYN